MHNASCTICGWLRGEFASEVDAKVAGLRHVGTEHPDVYEAVTGHKPTPEWLDGQELLMRSEGSAN